MPTLLSWNSCNSWLGRARAGPTTLLRTTERPQQVPIRESPFGPPSAAGGRMDPTTEAVRFALAIVMLAGASWSDWRTRRVRNQYWLPFVAFAAALALGDALREEPSDLLAPYATAAACCLLFYLVWRL